MEEKYCPYCNDNKPITAFSVDSKSPDGRQRRCKLCYRGYYEKNKEKIIARSYTYYSDNKEGCAAKKHSSYLKNREEIIRRTGVYQAEHIEQHRVWARKSHLKTKFNLTVEEFEHLLIEQDYQCAICGTDTPGGKGTWHIDHDHSCCPGVGSCGECIRGLLCQKCNSGLGSFNDDQAVLENAVEYLRRRVVARNT